MPLLLAGMHRSGTSLVARLLVEAGIDLGPAHRLLPASPDNPEGFFEHQGFVAVNDGLLDDLGGTWYLPPDLPAGWANAPERVPRMRQVDAILADWHPSEPWGWKDPRNALLLPFWLRRFPDLRVLICVRHPLEVARSLARRDDLAMLDGLRLWHRYHAALADALPAGRWCVTHYDSYFHDSQTELKRIRDSLELPLKPEQMALTSAVQPSLRHAQYAMDDLVAVGVPDEITSLYTRFCGQAGVLPPLSGSMLTDGERELVRQVLTSQLQLETSRQDAAELHKHLAVRRDQVAILTGQIGEQHRHILHLEQRLAWKRYRWADRFAAWASRLRLPGRSPAAQ
jgi:hypothetical protein